MQFNRFDSEVENKLTFAGWFAGRRVYNYVSEVERRLRESDSWEMFPIARSALLEFGGITFHEKGPGINVARESFTLDPILVEGERDRFERFEDRLNVSLFPLGEGGNGHFFIAIADNGKVYAIMDDILKIGDNVDEALNNLIIGIRPTRIER